MNSKFIIFLALLLTLAIFAPSVRSLLNLDSNKSLVIDINEEEHQNETEDQLDQQEFVHNQNSFLLLHTVEIRLGISSDALFIKNSTPLDILSPPPRYAL
jgi:cell division protein YceG involved in septum cleavage